MKTLKTEDLKSQYEFVCNEYVKTFCDKQNMCFNEWVANQIGTIAYCNDFYYFDFQDIMLDVNSNQPKGEIVDWYFENLEVENKHINYLSYTKGLRINQVK